MSDLFESQTQDHSWLVSRGAKGEIRCFELQKRERKRSLFLLIFVNCISFQKSFCQTHPELHLLNFPLYYIYFLLVELKQKKIKQRAAQESYRRINTMFRLLGFRLKSKQLQIIMKFIDVKSRPFVVCFFCFIEESLRNST